MRRSIEWIGQHPFATGLLALIGVVGFFLTIIGYSKDRSDAASTTEQIAQMEAGLQPVIDNATRETEQERRCQSSSQTALLVTAGNAQERFVELRPEFKEFFENCSDHSSAARVKSHLLDRYADQEYPYVLNYGFVEEKNGQMCKTHTVALSHPDEDPISPDNPLMEAAFCIDRTGDIKFIDLIELDIDYEPCFPGAKVYC